MVTTASIIRKIRGRIKDRLQTDGRFVDEYDTDSSFKLPEPYVDSTSITVYQNGTELPETEWSYNTTTNKVTITFITSGYSLTKGDDILIIFSYYRKYSDTEITAYIESSLLEFTARKYAKRFYLNSNDEVVTENGENPTEAEGDVIAIITAIDIDPQNIRIRTPEFTIEPTEKKSKQELIDDVFSVFQRHLGSIIWLQTDIE